MSRVEMALEEYDKMKERINALEMSRVEMTIKEYDEMKERINALEQIVGVLFSGNNTSQWEKDRVKSRECDCVYVSSRIDESVLSEKAKKILREKRDMLIAEFEDICADSFDEFDASNMYEFSVVKIERVNKTEENNSEENW